MRIRFDKTDGFTRNYDGTSYLVLFGSEKFGFIYNRIRYLISVRSGITYNFSWLRKNQSRFVRFFTSIKSKWYIYINYKWYIMIELTFVKELIFIRQSNENMYAIGTMVC